MPTEVVSEKNAVMANFFQKPNLASSKIWATANPSKNWWNEIAITSGIHTDLVCSPMSNPMSTEWIRMDSSTRIALRCLAASDLEIGWSTMPDWSRLAGWSATGFSVTSKAEDLEVLPPDLAISTSPALSLANKTLDLISKRWWMYSRMAMANIPIIAKTMGHAGYNSSKPLSSKGSNAPHQRQNQVERALSVAVSIGAEEVRRAHAGNRGRHDDEDASDLQTKVVGVLLIGIQLLLRLVQRRFHDVL